MNQSKKSKESSCKELAAQADKLGEKLKRLQRTHKHLKTENKFFEMLISSLPGIFYLFDNNLELHKWNRKTEDLVGTPLENDSDRTLLDLFVGEDQKRMQDVIQMIFEKGEGSTEAELVTRDGRRTPHLFTGVSATIDRTPYLIGVGVDISERKKAEEELRESEALYRILAERMTEGVMLFQAGKVLFVNHAFASLFGYDNPSEVIDSDITDLFANGSTTYLREMYDALQNDVNAEKVFQTPWVTRKGLEIWVEGRSTLIKWKGQLTVLLSVRNITEAKLREISMQEEAESLRKENVSLRSSIKDKDRYRLGNIIGKSLPMQKVYELILDAADSDANIIIYGESGTGKELIAGAIHEMSPRSEKPLVIVNCAAIPENLLESEFFGHSKGAFTGAHKDKQGHLDLADKGTLFLDEVGALNLSLQAKLLRAIEGGGYSPVGSNIAKNSDFRIIAATNTNLFEQTQKELMRKDFFFRIHIIPINLPPLRRRKDDIPLLVEHFLRHYSGGKKIPLIPGKVLEALINYDWPGNVRELQNVIQRFLTVGRLEFLTDIEPGQMDIGYAGDNANGRYVNKTGLRRTVESVERDVIKNTLDRHNANKSKSAEVLGITRKTLSRKMKRLGLS